MINYFLLDDLVLYNAGTQGEYYDKTYDFIFGYMRWDILKKVRGEEGKPFGIEIDGEFDDVYFCNPNVFNDTLFFNVFVIKNGESFLPVLYKMDMNTKITERIDVDCNCYASTATDRYVVFGVEKNIVVHDRIEKKWYEIESPILVNNINLASRYNDSMFVAGGYGLDMKNERTLIDLKEKTIRKISKKSEKINHLGIEIESKFVSNVVDFKDDFLFETIGDLAIKEVDEFVNIGVDELQKMNYTIVSSKLDNKIKKMVFKSKSDSPDVYYIRGLIGK